jgi:hypothetical protein
MHLPCKCNRPVLFEWNNFERMLTHVLVHVCLQELRGLGMTATNEEPEWKVAALGKVRTLMLSAVSMPGSLPAAFCHMHVAR